MARFEYQYVRLHAQHIQHARGQTHPIPHFFLLATGEAIAINSEKLNILINVRITHIGGSSKTA